MPTSNDRIVAEQAALLRECRQVLAGIAGGVRTSRNVMKLRKVPLGKYWSAPQEALADDMLQKVRNALGEENDNAG